MPVALPMKEPRPSSRSPPKLLLGVGAAAALLLVLLANQQHGLGHHAAEHRSAHDLSSSVWQLQQQLGAVQAQLGSLAEAHNASAAQLQVLVDSLVSDRHATGPVWVTDEDMSVVTLAGHRCSAARGGGLSQKALGGPGLVAPLVILTHNRANYLARTFFSLYRAWAADPANAAKFPLALAVDGDHQPTLLLASVLKFVVPSLQLIRNEHNLRTCKYNALCNLSMAYKALLELFFDCAKVPRLLILEDDLEVAPDFFTYFEATAPLLSDDPSLWCISAWNDHGQAGRASNASALYRTDVMPGLGWMLNRAVGLELVTTWPRGAWDDHMRRPEVRRQRQCVFPEVARTHTFGSIGTSGGQFAADHLDNMLLNTQPINWTAADLSYLKKDSYAALMKRWLAVAAPLTKRDNDLARFCSIKAAPDTNATAGDMVATYRSPDDFVALANVLKPMMADLRAESLPRSSYGGVVVVRCRGRRLFLAPTAALAAAKQQQQRR